VSPHSTVLLLSSDAMTLALVGLLVELAGFRPAFADEDERPMDAILRLRPLAAVLVDDMYDLARSDVFLAWAAQQRIPLAIFAGKGAQRGDTSRIRARGISVIDPPLAAEAIGDAIRTASASQWWRGPDAR
jgi:hypothetical protein